MGFFAAVNAALFALSGGVDQATLQNFTMFMTRRRYVLTMSIELGLQDISDLRLEVSAQGLHTQTQSSDKCLTTHIYNKMLVFG